MGGGSGLITTGFIRQDSGTLKNQLLQKEQNLKQLFDLILTEGEISRAALTAKTGLSPTTVSALTGELVESGLVISCGIDKRPSVGRKALLFRVNPERLQIPTFAFEQFGLRYALYDLAFNELESLYFPITERNSDYIRELPSQVRKNSKSSMSLSVERFALSYRQLSTLKGIRLSRRFST